MATPLRYLLLAAFVQILWGLTPSASRLVLDSLPVPIYGALRFAVSGAIFLSVAFLRGQRFARGRDAFGVGAVGILSFGLASLGTLYGLSLGGVVNLALASTLNGPIAALVALWVLRERRGSGFGWAMALSVAGGLCLVVGKCGASGWQIAFGSLACLWGAYGLEALGLGISKRWRSRIPIMLYLGTAHLAASLFLGATAYAMGVPLSSLAAVTSVSWGAFVFVALVSCCLCYFLLYWLIERMDGHRLAFFDAFHSLSAALFGWIFFHETLTPLMAAGGALLLGAVGILNPPVLRRTDELHVTDQLLDEGRAKDVVGI